MLSTPPPPPSAPQIHAPLAWAVSRISEIKFYVLDRRKARSRTYEHSTYHPYALGEDLSVPKAYLYANATMSLDSLSFVAPARVEVLIIPVGRIKRSRFLSFLSRLRQENVVRLGDVSPDGRPHRSMALQCFPLLPSRGRFS